MAASAPPLIPVPLAGLPKYLSQHPNTPMTQLFEPYRKYETYVREAFAQNPHDGLLKDPYVNVLPLFTEDTQTVRIRARDLAKESKEEKSKYIMPLPKTVRRSNDSPAVVQELKDFKRNFNVFSESSLVELDWSNVVAAGSSVTNCLLPVPDEYNATKRGLREFYHEKFSPASDVDLFLYGLTEEEAIEKIKKIEAQVRDALLTEITVVRTKHAITICSQYPTRHIQIVLRIYKSVSEILTGFDIDCSGAAYDGSQVFCTPRALQSFMTQINHIDLSRRSPSYENRLSKYSHKGFEVYWPDLDRSRIDPTIFERSFQRTLGLARLLVLERLPTTSTREKYRDQRRAERGRPPNNNSNFHEPFAGNIKEDHEDEVADWLSVEEESNYNTFAIPYGPRIHAKRIEKYCYTKDLLLNADWNQREERKVYLHRHPAFFGRFEDVVGDCCGYCPVPRTEEELKTAEEESKIYVSGRISFLKDDPGRQSIGSFNPLTENDWTEMAYVGDTALLCQAIVDGDAEKVAEWLGREDADPNTRDYTGRTPLHLAVMSSTPEIVRLLVDAGARLVARLADGRTALHLAAARGHVEIVKILMAKSIANEAEHEEKEEKRRKEANTAGKNDDEAHGDVDMPDQDENEDRDEDEEMEEDEDWEGSGDDGESRATGSFVKVRSKAKENAPADDLALEENEDEPDFYDINVIAWDRPCSALHFAIIEGHTEVVKTLCQEYGADVLLPIKFMRPDKTPTGALLTLVLPLILPVPEAKEMAETLLSLGATSAQADIYGVTAFHSYVEKNSETLLGSLWEHDPAGAQSAINHVVFPSSWGPCKTSLQVAVEKGDLALVLKLLDHGAIPHVDFETWLKAAKQSVNIQGSLSTFENNQKLFQQKMEQPLISAINSSNPSTALGLLERGADPNVVTSASYQYMQGSWYVPKKGESALDLVNKYLAALRNYEGEPEVAPPKLPVGIDIFPKKYKPETYQHWLVTQDTKQIKDAHRKALEEYKKTKAKSDNAAGVAEKKAAIQDAIATMEHLKAVMIAAGAKSFGDIFPDYRDPAATATSLPANNQQNSGVDLNRPVYKFTFSFTNVIDVTEARKAAYINLFEAAWRGDLETIKTLTLTAWDDEKQEAPLNIAVCDANSNNPFSLAFFRGHLTVATAVLEIAQAQYTPDAKSKPQYRAVVNDPSRDLSDNESVYSEDDELNIFREIIGGDFTIENVGQVSMKVNSRTKPQELLDWNCPAIDYDEAESSTEPKSCSPLLRSVVRNDKKGVEFLLDIGKRFSSQATEPGHEISGLYVLPNSIFENAIHNGRTELLAELIKSTGAGLPLEEMVKNTGVALVEKPKYYQGLTVYGKKRRDWATAGQGARYGTSGNSNSPLLIAALAGSIESVEWFLSDAPLRHYLTFCNSKAARDPRVKHLAQSAGGYEGAIKQWLNKDSDLIIHAAIYASPSKKADELVSYLVKAYPGLVDTKDSNGATPLLTACRFGRLNIIKRLVQAGADQSTRDQDRNNILHGLLHWRPTADALGTLFSLLNPGLLAHMLKERNSLAEDGRTPLHAWIFNSLNDPYSTRGYENTEAMIEVLKLLIAISPETAKQAFQMLDGVGNTPLHTLLTDKAEPSLVRTVLEFDPTLLLLENAVGRTPIEVVHDLHMSEHIKANNSDNGRHRYYYEAYPSPSSTIAELVTRDPSFFVQHSNSEARPSGSLAARNLFLCNEILSQTPDPKKRKLVSLHSANLVAKRLGERHTSVRYNFSLKRKAGSDDAGGDDGDDDGNVSDTLSEVGSNSGEKTKTAGAAPPARAQNKRRRRETFISSRYSDRYESPWVIPE